MAKGLSFAFLMLTCDVENELYAYLCINQQDQYTVKDNQNIRAWLVLLNVIT